MIGRANCMMNSMRQKWVWGKFGAARAILKAKGQRGDGVLA